MEVGTSQGSTLCRRILLVLAVMLAAVLVAVVAPSAMAEDVTWEDKVVYGAETHLDINLTLDGNLTVAEGGHLRLEDVDMVVNATRSRQYRVVVDEGGLLELLNVTIDTAGGTFGIEVRGTLNFTGGTLTGLDAEHHLQTVPRGLVAHGQGQIVLTSVDVSNPGGHALVLNDTSSATVVNGSLFGASMVVRMNSGSQLTLSHVEVVADQGTELVMMSASGVLVASDTTFRSDKVYSPSVHNVAVHLLGDGNMAFLDRCTIATAELAIANGGYVEITGSTFEPGRTRAIPDLFIRDAKVLLEDIDLVEVNAHNCSIELVGSTFRSGSVTNGSVISSYGPVPPLGLLANDTVVHHHYWVDFLLLNRTGEPKEGMLLAVLNSEGGLVVDEARTDGQGMVRHVPIRSWTIDGVLFRYEPSHRVEFWETSQQISNLQVYDNATVVLWDMVGSHDLALVTDRVTPSVPAPEENRTFDIVVDGKALKPRVWAEGTAQAVLYVDDVAVSEVTFGLDDQGDLRFRDLNVTAGTHIFRVVVDPSDALDEMNEGGNNEVRFILDVAPEGGTGELIDLTVEIDRVGDTEGNSGEELIPGIIYVDYTVRVYNSKIIQRNVPVGIYINGEMDDLVRVDLTNQQGDVFSFSGQFRPNLARGEYVIKVVVDPFDEIDEEREYNNEDQVTVTLSEEVTDPPFFDSECCASLLVFGLVALVGILGAWAQRRQRLAAEGGAPAQYEGVTQPTVYGPSYGGPGQVTPQQETAMGREPVSLDERWRVEQAGAAYTADGWEEGVAERITAPRERMPPSRERYKATDLTCPRCKGREIMGFSDGSAKCQSCKKIFYPGRRY